MKKFRTMLLITGILVAGLAFSVSAQKRAGKTSSAKAYYGPSNPNYKAKKHKKHKSSLRKSSRNKWRTQASHAMVMPKRWF